MERQFVTAHYASLRKINYYSVYLRGAVAHAMNDMILGLGYMRDSTYDIFYSKKLRRSQRMNRNILIRSEYVCMYVISRF